jgi:hypothetical protein
MGQIQYDSATGSGVIGVGKVAAGDCVVTSDQPMRFVTGVIALDGGNPTPVTTGLSIVVGGGATIKATVAPGVATQVVTANWASTLGGTMNLYSWKPTGTGDCTMVAGDGTENVQWWAIGQ